jgi:hypothetical protein
MNTHDIGSKIEKLPDHVIPEVNDYIDFMLSRYGLNNNTSKFTFGWEGKLSKLRNKYTSVELQHKSNKWR